MHRPGHRPISLAQRHEPGREPDRVARQVERVDPIHHLVGTAGPDVFRHGGETGVGSGVQSPGTTDHDRFGDALRPQTLGGGEHPGILSLGEDQAGVAGGRAVKQRVPEGHPLNRRARAVATTG